MQFDIAAFDFQVSPLGGGQDFLFGTGIQVAGGASQGDFLVGGSSRLAALALQADAAAGGMEMDAGFLAGFLFVARFANGVEGETVLYREAVVALDDEVGVLPGGDGEVFAGGQDLVLGGELGDAGRGVELEARFGPGGNAAGAALRGFDDAVPTLPDVLAGGGLQDAGCVLEAVDGGKRIGGRVALEGGVLLGGDGGEALAEALGVFGLGDGFAAVEVGAAGVGPGVGAEVETVAGTQGEAGLGLEFGAVAAVGLAGVAGLLFEVTELEVALILGGAEFDAGFARGVVEDEMVVATLPVPAGSELLGLEAGEAGLVGVLSIALAGEEGGGVGAGLLSAAAEAVAGDIGLAATVVGGADDEGAVDVAVLEGDEDFLAGTRYEVAAPVAAGDGTHDAEPDAEGMAGRGVV